MEKSNESAQNNTGGETQANEYVRKGGSNMISEDDFATFEELSDTKVSAKYPKTKGGGENEKSKSSSGGKKTIEKQAEEEVALAKQIGEELEKEMGLDAKKQQAQASKEETKEELTEEKTEENLEDKPKVVPYKFKQGDEELDIDPSTTVQVKINGKLENVAVKDLISEFSGMTDYKRKYSALDVERKTFQNEVRELDSRVNKLHDLAVKEKNPRLAIGYLAEMLGADPREVWQSLKSEISQALEASRRLSPAEQEALEAKEEAEYYKRKVADTAQEAKKSQELETLKSRVLSTQEKYGMSPTQFKAAYDELVREATATGYKEDDLTPEMVGEYHQILQRNGELKSMVQETFLSDTDRKSVYAELKGVWAQNPSFTIEDIKDIATQVFKTKKQSGLAKRIEAQNKKENTNTRMSKEHLETWEDLAQF